MSVMTPLPADDPRLVAWTSYTATEDYRNTKKWAEHTDHGEGSLWAAFIAGWAALAALAPEGEAEGHAAQLRVAIAEEREACARIADHEEELDGPIPVDLAARCV